MEILHEEALASAGVRADGTIDINAMLRTMLEDLLNAVMDEQASELGAVRNGYREHSPDACVGTVTTRIPKLREGGYYFSRRRRLLLVQDRHGPGLCNLRHVTLLIWLMWLYLIGHIDESLRALRG